jgi:hypothetical protein
MYRIFKYYISMTHPRDAECYPYEAANKIDDILKLRKAM